MPERFAPNIVRTIPNHIDDPPLVVVFRALSDATRLAVIERLSIYPASATVLARPFEMTLPSFMQHLAVLECAGIVTSHKIGRTRTYQLAPEPLRAAAEWLSTHRSHWERRLDQLGTLLEAVPPGIAKPNKKKSERTGPEVEPS